VDGVKYPQIRQDKVFMQCNVHIGAEMLKWASAQCHPALYSGPPRDLFEPFCGNGNFTLPLSAHFRATLATELDPVAVDAALECAKWANVNSRIDFRALSAAQALRVVNSTREGRGGMEEKNWDFGTLFVNPPREGLEDSVRLMARQMDNILYISCNPHTLLRDLNEIMASGTHQVSAAALFDQFPHSRHAEVGIALRRR